MYVLPQPHRCPVCGHECEFGPDDRHPAPVLKSGKAICPECWEAFICEHCGVLECTVKFK